MAEVLGAVSGGIGIASFAIQVSESVMKLKAFWSKAKNAPEEIQYVLEELETYSELLSGIERQNNRHDLPDIDITAITRSTSLCRKGLKVLTEMIRDSDAVVNKHRVHGGIKFVLKEGMIDTGRTRLECARNLLHTAYTVYCTALNRHQIQLQHRTMELQQKTFELQSSAADSSNAKITNIMTSVANIHTTLEGKEPNSMDFAVQQYPQDSAFQMPPIGKTTWMDYFVGSVSYQKQYYAKKLNDSQISPVETSYSIRIRIPGWWKAQVWDIHLARATSGWTNYLQVYNVVSRKSTQFQYAMDGEVEPLRDLILSGQASLNDRDERGHSLLFWASKHLQPDICQLLLTTGRFEHDRELHPFSLMQGLKYGIVASNGDKVPQFQRCFEILFKYTEPVLTEADSDLLGKGNMFRLFPYESMRSKPFFRSYAWITNPLEQRVHLLRNLLWTHAMRNNLDHFVDLVNLTLGPETGPDKIEATGSVIDLCRMPLAQMLTFVLHWMAKSIVERHLPGTNESRRILKLAVDCGALMFLGSLNTIFHFLISYVRWSSLLDDSLSVLQNEIQVWATELFNLGVDLETYGQHHKHKRLRGYFSGIARFFPLRKQNTVLQYLTENQDLLFSYGSTPVQWKVYLTNPLDEYAGAFWCMVENPPQKVPGAWEEDTGHRYWESELWNDEILGTDETWNWE